MSFKAINAYSAWKKSNLRKGWSWNSKVVKLLKPVEGNKSEVEFIVLVGKSNHNLRVTIKVSYVDFLWAKSPMTASTGIYWVLSRDIFKMIWFFVEIWYIVVKSYSQKWGINNAWVYMSRHFCIWFVPLICKCPS